MDGFYYEFNTNFKGTVYICNNRTLFSWNTYITLFSVYSKTICVYRTKLMYTYSTHNKLGTYWNLETDLENKIQFKQPCHIKQSFTNLLLILNIYILWGKNKGFQCLVLNKILHTHTRNNQVIVYEYRSTWKVMNEQKWITSISYNSSSINFQCLGHVGTVEWNPSLQSLTNALQWSTDY